MLKLTLSKTSLMGNSTSRLKITQKNGLIFLSQWKQNHVCNSAQQKRMQERS